MRNEQKVSIFVGKLWSLLQNYGKSDDLVRWTQDGTAFAILDRKKLCQTYLPRYFKHTKFSSFVRQLNMYNFKKVKGGECEDQYQHDLFRKDKKHLLVCIKRNRTERDILIQNSEDDNLQINCQEQAIIPSRPSFEEIPNSSIKVEPLQEEHPRILSILEKENQHLKTQKDILNKQVQKLTANSHREFQKMRKFFECLTYVMTYNRLVDIDQNAFLQHFKSEEPSFQSYFEYLMFSSAEKTMMAQVNLIPSPVMIGMPHLIPYPNPRFAVPAFQFQP